MKFLNFFKRKSQPRFTTWPVDKDCICEYCKNECYLVDRKSDKYNNNWIEHNIYRAGKYGE